MIHIHSLCRRFRYFLKPTPKYKVMHLFSCKMSVPVPAFYANIKFKRKLAFVIAILSFYVCFVSDILKCNFYMESEFQTLIVSLVRCNLT